MNCPTCGAPLMFGAVRCDCGAIATSKRLNEVDLTYLESLRVYWRIYWPSQLAGILWNILFAVFVQKNATGRVFVGLVLGIVVNLNALWLVLPRIWNKPYQGFGITIVSPYAGEPIRKLAGLQRLDLLWAIVWRQWVALILASFASAPLGAIIGMMGLKMPVAVFWLVGVLAVGPIIMKMIIGNQFSGFTLEVRRGTAGEIALTSPATQP